MISTLGLGRSCERGAREAR